MLCFTVPLTVNWPNARSEARGCGFHLSPHVASSAGSVGHLSNKRILQKDFTHSGLPLSMKNHTDDNLTSRSRAD